MLAVELYTKWYCLYVVYSDRSLKVVTFDALEPYAGDESAYVDHVPNPNAAMRYAAVKGFDMSEVGYTLMVGRWEIEAKDRYDYGFDDAPDLEVYDLIP